MPASLSKLLPALLAIAQSIASSPYTAIGRFTRIGPLAMMMQEHPVLSTALCAAFYHKNFGLKLKGRQLQVWTLLLTSTSWLLWRNLSVAGVVRKQLLHAGVSCKPRTIGAVSSVRRLLPLLIPLPPVLGLLSGLRKRRGVVYARLRKSTLTCDIMDCPGVPPPHRRRPAAGKPVLLYLHGGSWSGGHSSWAALPLLYELAHRGWLVVSANYRLSPKVAFPAHLKDAKRALIWLRRNADRYGGDRSFIAVGGESAGGHLACLVAATQNDPWYQSDDASADSSVDACVDLFGPKDILDSQHHWKGIIPFRWYMRTVVMQRQYKRSAFERASPFHRLQAMDNQAVLALPPTIIVHGKSDTTVPVEDSYTFHTRLVRRRKTALADAAARGQTAAPPAAADCLIALEGTEHTFDLTPSLRLYAVADGVGEWLETLWRAAGEKAMPARL
eukprot:PLAT8400.1.p1 GENE.PLAT8400.1~~PLAT8400.1.p1  ORF type:complete len:452 (-),score=104.66 PLAT8400.1:67-1398(-)